jgi:putative tryptophan/tyrosine transport system substrate-binding protein
MRANATGLVFFEYSLSAKWLELLKQIAPSVNRVAVMRDPGIAAGIGQYGAIQSVGPSFAVELTPVNVQDTGDIEREVGEFASVSNGGLIVTASAPVVVHRKLIISLAARHKLPAVYFEHYFPKDGGLISYGPSIVDQCKRAATFVDKILRGAKPADLPVQAPTKYELVVNLKTANSLGLTIPAALLARADEVIE